MLERLKCMLIKEFIQVFRNPKMRAVVLVMPLVQTLVFGYAVTTDVNHVPTAVYDQSQTPDSRNLIDKFGHSGYFDIKTYLTNDQQINELLNYGKVATIIRIPPDYSQKIAAGQKAPVQIIVDGTDSNTAGVVLSYSSRIVGDSATLLLQQQSDGTRNVSVGINLETRAWFNENLTSRNFYVPGVIAILVMLVTLLLTSMAVVREKEVGTMEQIIVTPISSFEFILGKTMPSIMIGFTNVAFITLIGVLWFNIPVRGSLLLLFLATTLFLMTTIGIGLFISTVSKTQQQAMMSTFFFYFPAVLLSGFMFPIANMPDIVQFFTYLNPLRYFLIIIRGIFLKGIGITVLWPQLAALLALGSAVLFAAVRRFRKNLA
ncbi:ABC transporter permease [Sporomusa sp. KB1]|jgi:ABC-2 type transport system permease protein|uniref:ABC transporter permease n=1 Tax=Sporomusa sp. KB1 TaxID=943346 RepID=UPI0011A8DCA0|nr:ABC transporter permease [Sporomusa sp. KB1]TWH47291.1 ABC-2 type transport system permease protein [Sporomusa sp. KB1]